MGAIEYFEWIGKTFGDEYHDRLREDNYQSRRLELKKAMLAIHAYELELSRSLLSALEAIPGLQLYGLSDPNRLKGLHPRMVAEQLAEQGIYVTPYSVLTNA